MAFFKKKKVEDETEEVQTTFNTDDMDELVEDGEVENVHG